MNIQKSRLVSFVGLALAVCMIFGMMVMPASAASSDVNSILLHIGIKGVNSYDLAAAVLDAFDADCPDGDYRAYAELVSGLDPNVVSGLFVGDDGRFYIHADKANYILDVFKGVLGIDFVNPEYRSYFTNGKAILYVMDSAYFSNADLSSVRPTSIHVTFVPASNVVSGATAKMSISNVLTNVVELLPVALTFLVGAIAIAKAVSFFAGAIRGA